MDRLTPNEWLLAAAAATVLIWQIPSGQLLLFPFTMLAIWFHEMCHGLAAMLLGGRFTRLDLEARGAGAAHYTVDVSGGRLGRALVAAAGPLGPPLAGAGLLWAGRDPTSGHWTLIGLGAVLVFSGLWWVRSLFGWLFVFATGAALVALAHFADPAIQTFALQFLGVQACISTFRQIRYLFTREVKIGNKLMLSDTGQIAHWLFGPHWIWGGLMSAVTVGILLWSLRDALPVSFSLS